MDTNKESNPSDEAVNQPRLIDFLIALGEEKITILLVGSVVILLAALYLAAATPIYTARTAILLQPPNQGGISNAIGALSGMAGLPLGGKSSDEMYLELLRSQSLQDDMIDSLKLLDYFNIKSRQSARARLKGVVKLNSLKKAGIIEIMVDDKSPVMAAKLANSHVDAMSRLLGRIAVTEAQQRRLFFEKQVKSTLDLLEKSESNFRSLSSKGGLPFTELIAQSNISSGVNIRAQIAAKEVELRSMSQFNTSQHPNTQRLASELGALRAQLSRIEEGGLNAGKVTAQGQAAVAALRDIKSQQAMLEVFTKQLEMARVDEARDGPLIQQIDVAKPPEQKSKPKRFMLMIVAIILGMVLGASAALVRRRLKSSKNNPETRQMLGKLRQSWSITLRRT